MPNDNDNQQRDNARCVVSRSYDLSDSQKLTGTANYHHWAFLMKGCLLNEGLWKVTMKKEIDGDKNDKAFWKIVMNIQTNLQSLLINKEQASDAWEILEKHYGSTNSSSRLELYQSLFSVKLEQFNGNMAEYLQRIVGIQERLSNQGKGLDDETVAYIMLIGLTPQYEPIQMTLSARDGALSSDFVAQKLNGFKLSTPVADTASFTKSGNKEKRIIKCHFCDAPGHYKNKCRKWKAEQAKKSADKPSKKQNDPKTAHANHVKHIEVERCMLTRVVSTPHVPAHVPEVMSPAPHVPAHVSEVMLSAPDPVVNLTQDAAFAVQTVNSNCWFVDSGASKHMCREGDLYSSMEDFQLEIAVANQARIPCKGKGTVNLDLPEGNVKISNVLYVPDLSANLLSVSAMVDSDLLVTFDKSGCRVTKNNATWIQAERREGLFVLNHSSTQALSAMVSKETWHKRLGHLSTGAMKKLQFSTKALKGIKLDVEDCEVCLKGKMTRAPFPHGESKRASQFLQLIHSDLLGPADVLSYGGSRYVLTFTDDFSRKIFSYAIAQKSETFEKFKTFKILVENQTDSKIKVLRSDNGGEYIGGEFATFLEENGIVHQTSCPYTPQQNGLSERVNRTILDMARCILLESGLNRRFWAECITTAVYVRNRCPSAPLNNLSPEEVWTVKT